MQLSAKFEDALQHATRIHAGQLRKGTEIPYVAHVLGVAAIALEHGATEEEAIAALLHDAAEDAGGHEQLRTISELFGDRVAQIVHACSDTLETPKPPWKARKVAYLETIPTKSASARLVSAADKLHNARAILSDFRVDGEALWDRFTGGKAGTLWYYRELVSALNKAGDNLELVRELDRVVTELENLAG